MGRTPDQYDTQGPLDHWFTKVAVTILTRPAGQVAGRGARVGAAAPGPLWTTPWPSGGQPCGRICVLGSAVPLERPRRTAGLAPVCVPPAPQGRAASPASPTARPAAATTCHG